MGKCKDRTKKFFKGLLGVITPQLMFSGATLASTLATNIAAGALSGHDKRKIMVSHLKAVAEGEGNRLEEWAARAVNEYLYKTVIKDGVPPNEVTDVDDDMDPEQPDLA